MGCCSSPRTTVAGVAVLHFFGALGCIGLCSYLLSLQGPKLEQILTQSWTLLTTMHLPVVVDADGNVVSNHSHSSTEAAVLDKGNTTPSRARGRSAYDVQPLLVSSKSEPTLVTTEDPDVLVSDEHLRHESAEVSVSFISDREARILESDDDLSDATTESLPTTELHSDDLMTDSPEVESSESQSDLDEYITDNVPTLSEETGSLYQNISSENSSMEYENVTEAPIINFESLRKLDELLFSPVATTEDTDAASLNSVSSVLFVDEPDHTVTSIGLDSTDAPTNDSSNANSQATQVAPPYSDEVTTPPAINSKRMDNEQTSPSPSSLPLDLTSGDDALTSTEFIPVSPHTSSVLELTTQASTPEIEPFLLTTKRSSSNNYTAASISAQNVERATSTIPDLTSTSSPSTAGSSASSAPESLPSALPLRSQNAATYSHLLVDENSSSVNVGASGNTSNISSTEKPFTITVPPLITTTGFLSILLTSSPADPDGDPELDSLLFELRAGASVLGLLVYFILCAIAAALLIAAAIWRLAGLMVPWLVMEWISVFAAITAVGVLTWRLLVEGVLLWCWWVVVLGTAGVVVLILCLVLVLEAYQTLPYEATCDTTDSYELQYVADKRRTSISGAQRSERLQEYWCGRESTSLR